jgi:hypothetical protein
MGFFDFMKRAISAVAGIDIEHSGIAKSLGSVAGMVAHAIPVVGPVIDAGVNALSAVFSNDSPPPQASGRDLKPELDQAIAINLKRSEDEIKKALEESITHLQDGLEEKFKKVASLVKQTESEIKRLFSHDAYLTQKSAVTTAIEYMLNHRGQFKKVTASSPVSNFNEFFDNSDGGGTLPSARLALRNAITAIEIRLEDTTLVSCPSQEMFDLYLMATQYLLLFDKSIIITRGLKAKLHRVNQQYSTYIETSTKLYSDIDNLRNDAKHIHEKLSNLVHNFVQRRPKEITCDLFDEEHSALVIEDNWPAMAVGWISQEELKAKIPFSLQKDLDVKTDPSKKEQIITDAKKPWVESTNVSFYKEIMQKTLDAYLQPAYAVIDTLEQNLHQWNSRIPVTPSTLEGDEYHVKPTSTQEDTKFQGTSLLWGKELRYMVTYVNVFGESPPSDLSPIISLPKNKKIVSVELKLHKLVFDDDPLAGIPAIKVGGNQEVAPDRGIRRRIYVQYPNNANPDKSDYQFVAEISEAEMTYSHKTMENLHET